MTTIEPMSGGMPGRVTSAGGPDRGHRPAFASPSGRGDRVATLRDQIERGTYDVPAEAVADAILSSVRSSGRAAYEAAARFRLG